MTESRKERLYNLLPSVYRARDIKEGEPLRALLELIEGQMQLLEEDIDGLYEDWFIETCDDWVIPYIGDLLGVHPIHSFSENSASTRGYVANTIAYRRRKGTASVLEQVCHDVTGWNAHAVEFFQLLAVTQNLNHLRLDRGQTACVRDADEIELVGGPFETTAHTLSVRGIESLGGKYNIPNIGIFLWRLQSYPMRQARAGKRDGKNRYTFDPTGLDIPLFNRPQTEKLIVHLSEEVNVPGPLRRYPLYAELEGRRKGSTPKLSYFDPDEPVFGIYIVPEEVSEPLRVPEEDIFICNMADEWHYPASLAEKEITWLSDFRFEVEANGGMANDRSFFAGEVVELFSDQRNNPGVFAAIKKAEKSDSRWMLTADRDISIFSTHTNRRARKITAAVDPESGRLTILEAASPKSVLVDYYYGFSYDVGAGPYDRTSFIRKMLGEDVDWQVGVSKRNLEGREIFKTIGEALDSWDSILSFRWEEVPGLDEKKLINMLVQKFAINWVEHAKFKKGSDGKAIYGSAEEESLSIKLDDKKNEAVLEINGKSAGIFEVMIKNLFSWTKIPGTDDKRLKEFLGKRYHIEWVYTAGIAKSEDGKVISISQEDTKLSLTLNEDDSEVILKIDNIETDKFIAKEENGELNIYKKDELKVYTGIKKVGLITVMDSHTYDEDLRATIPRGCKLLVIGADWPNPTLIGQFSARDIRPHLQGDIEIDVPGGTASNMESDRGELIIDGLLIEGKLKATSGSILLQVAHTALLPDTGGIVIENASSAELIINRSICGPIKITGNASSLNLRESIVDSADKEENAIAADKVNAQIDRCTVLGKSHMRRLEASNSIFAGDVAVTQRQEGCVRYSSLPVKSKAPKRFRCQPDLAVAEAKETLKRDLSDEERGSLQARLVPLFTSVHYGDPGYAQLSRFCAEEIRTGAEDGSEMGVFGILQQPQREANLRAALEEYLRFGLEAGIFFVT